MRGTHSGVWVHVSVCPCLCLFPVRVRQGDTASRLTYSGSENAASGAGEVRALWGLSFAPCKMGITIPACPQRLLQRSNETVDLNSKEPFELSSVSGCAHGCVGVRAIERLCRELPATPFSCLDKSAVSSVPSHQKYTSFWPRAMLSNSPGGDGEWRRRPARWGPTLLGRVGHLVSYHQTVTMQGDRGHLCLLHQTGASLA